jgi:hypothetical protein
MGDLGYLSIKINVNPGNDACIILAQPSAECISDVVDCIKNIYNIGTELQKEIFKNVSVTLEKVDDSEISNKLIKTDEEVKIEMIDDCENDTSLDQNAASKESITKISSFAFFNKRCHFCDLNFTNESELSEHFYEKHEPLNVQGSDGRHEYQCRGCAKHFTQYPPAVKHCRVRVREIYQCPLCRTTIKQTSNIKRHKERCSGAESFFCSKCHKFIKSKSNFEKHFVKCGVKKGNAHGRQVPKEEGQEYINCHACDYKTLFGYIMKKHMTMEHSEIRDMVKCDKCEREFVSESGVRKHKKKVHSDVAYKLVNNFVSTSFVSTSLVNTS